MTGHRALVLVAEDDRELRRLMADTLHPTCDVVECPDGRAVLDHLRSAARRRVPYPDLIISDIRMPRLDGLAALRLVREADPWVPLILVSAWADEAADQLAEALGVMTTLRKPFDLDVLARWVALGVRQFVPVADPGAADPPDRAPGA